MQVLSIVSTMHAIKNYLNAKSPDDRGIYGGSILCIVVPFFNFRARVEAIILLMDKILHDPKDPKLWELWYSPYYG